MVDSQAKCAARGGRWDPVNKRCNIPEGETSQGTLPETPITTPREQAARKKEQAAVEVTEQRRTSKSQAAAAEAALDQPISSTKIDTQKSSVTQGEGRTVQNGVPGVIENGVFFADQQNQQKGQVIFDEQGNATGFVRPDGTALTGLNPNEVSGLLQGGETATDVQQQPNLAGQVGEFGQLGISPTGFAGDALLGAAAQGIIPGLIRGVGAGIGVGLLGAKVGAVGGPTGALVVGALGFASGISSSILSEMKGQRTDNTNAQQRVLDEGKQVLSDWITFAEANPSQKEFALKGFNQQLSLIQQAHRQMKLDTQRDLLKFESAVPNLAEFTAFYSPSGERDVYSDEMRIAMSQPSPIDTRMLDLFNRRKS